MKDTQKRQYNAAVIGKKEMDDNAAAYVGNTPMINKVTDLGNAITAVEGSEDAQGADTKGFTTSKKSSKVTMCMQAWIIAKPLSIYAKNTGNAVLLAEVDFELSDLVAVDDATSKDRCTLIKNRAVTNQAALTLGGYQITAAMTTALNTSINDFNTKKGAKGTAKSGTKAATANVKTNAKTMVGICDDILDLSTSYALSNPTFYNAVQDAFAIGTLGVRHRALRVTCSDQVTGVRRSKVDVTIVELGLTVKSSKRGIVDFSHQDLAEGNYTVRCVRNGYVVFELANVAVFDTKMGKVMAVMVKI
jgi:hypothetical protein